MSEGERWAASNNTAVLLLSSKGLHLSKPSLKRRNMKDGGTPSQNNWSDLMIIFWEVRDIWHVFHTECMFTCTFWTRFMTSHIVYSKQTRSGEKWLSELFIKESRLMTIYGIRHCTWACHIFCHLLTFLINSVLMSMFFQRCGLCAFPVASRHLCLATPDTYIYVTWKRTSLSRDAMIAASSHDTCRNQSASCYKQLPSWSAPGCRRQCLIWIWI